MNHSHSAIRTVALAVALTIPALSLAASVSDVVTTRDDQDVHQQFGRDSVYAIQTRQPAQTESRYSGNGSSGGEGVLASIGSAGAAAWDKVTGLFEPGSSAAAIPEQPRSYGRAGGYVGTDQLALLRNAEPAPATSEPVTTGESVSANDIRYPAASEDQLYGPAVVAQRAPSPEVGTVRDDELEAAPGPGSVSEQDLVTDQADDTGAMERPDQADPRNSQADPQ